jgi:hypothetical protein
LKSPLTTLLAVLSFKSAAASNDERRLRGACSPRAKERRAADAHVVRRVREMTPFCTYCSAAKSPSTIRALPAGGTTQRRRARRGTQRAVAPPFLRALAPDRGAAGDGCALTGRPGETHGKPGQAPAPQRAAPNRASEIRLGGRSQGPAGPNRASGTPVLHGPARRRRYMGAGRDPPRRTLPGAARSRGAGPALHGRPRIGQAGRQCCMDRRDAGGTWGPAGETPALHGAVTT